MGEIVYEVEVKSGIYKLMKPLGRLGAIQFGIIGKYIPTNIPDNGEMSPAQKDKLFEGFEVWAEKILPKIYKEGPYKVDEMPGEDQYALFLALTTDMEVSEELFRIVR